MTYSPEVLADTPAVYHDCQETAGTVLADGSGNGLPGAVVGGAIVNDTTDDAAPAALGRHVRLDGSNDYVQFDSGGWFTPGTNGFTWEGWFFIRSVANWQRFFDFANAPNTGDYNWGRDGTSGSMFANINAGGARTAGPYPSLLSWHHMVLSSTAGGAGVVYVDGAQVATPSFPTLTNAARANKYVGKSAHAADLYNPCSVTHLAVYNHVLSPTRVQAHYDAGVATLPSGALTVAGTLPAVQSSLTVRSFTHTDTSNGRSGRIRGGYAIHADNTDPVILPAAAATRRDKALWYPDPDLVDGRPT